MMIIIIYYLIIHYIIIIIYHDPFFNQRFIISFLILTALSIIHPLVEVPLERWQCRGMLLLNQFYHLAPYSQTSLQH